MHRQIHFFKYLTVTHNWFSRNAKNLVQFPNSFVTNDFFGKTKKNVKIPLKLLLNVESVEKH